MRTIGISVALLGAIASPAQAGVLTDDLSRCLVTKATEGDRSAFVAWMFSAVSSTPELQKITTLDRARRDQIAATAGSVFQRLIVVDCRKEAVAAMKVDGETALTQSFSELGRATASQMFQSPEAQKELKSLDKGFDKEKLKALGREAGIAQEDDAK